MPSYKELVDTVPISVVVNTDASTFWYTDKNLTTRYKHDEGKRGDVFYDGNNGDKWMVVEINTQWCRAVVRNVTQRLGAVLCYWE